MDLFDWAAGEQPHSAKHTEATASFATPPPSPQHVPPAPWPDADTPPDIPGSLAAALERVALRDGIAPETLRDWRSAVSRLAAFTGCSADRLPAAPAELGPLMDAVLPARHNIKGKTWRNIRAAIRGLLQELGVHAPKAVLHAPLAGVWAELLSRAPDSPQTACLRGLARWCDARGILPKDVDQLMIADYCEWRRCWTCLSLVTQLASNIRQGWNRFAGKVEGWPAHRLDHSRRFHGRRHLPLDSFPASFQDELQRYLASMTERADPLDVRSGRRLSPETVHFHREQLIGGATVLAQHLGGPDAITGLAKLVDEEPARLIILAEYDHKARKWRSQALPRISALTRVADRWLRSDVHRAKLCEFRRSISEGMDAELRRIGGSCRRREMLREFDDPVVLRKFLDLPEQCCRRADRFAAEGRLVTAAHAHERGLALALLQEFALRRRNLANIDIARHFQRDSRGRIIALTIDGSETKNGVTLGGRVRPELARRIERHLSRHRPQLLKGRESNWLFPAKTGSGHCSIEALTVRLRKTIATFVGIRMGPHGYRHLVAKLFAENDPTAMPVVQRVLGHADLKTTERMYGTMTTAAAQATYAAMLDKVRVRTRRAEQSRTARKEGRP